MTTKQRWTTEHVHHFQRRVLQDALTEATAAYWERRADDFLTARPRRGDHHGEASAAQLSARWQRLTAVAAACRAKAEVVRRYGLDDAALADLDDVLEEVA